MRTSWRLADVYDVLISERVYKSAYTHEQAVEIIRDGRGSHFDPDMVYAFLTLSEEFRRITQQFADAEPARMAADLPMERIELTSREEPLCVAVPCAGGPQALWLCPSRVVVVVRCPFSPSLASSCTSASTSGLPVTSSLSP